jgi:hypothetical protein
VVEFDWKKRKETYGEKKKKENIWRESASQDDEELNP